MCVCVCVCGEEGEAKGEGEEEEEGAEVGDPIAVTQDLEVVFEVVSSQDPSEAG